MHVSQCGRNDFALRSDELRRRQWVGFARTDPGARTRTYAYAYAYAYALPYG